MSTMIIVVFYFVIVIFSVIINVSISFSVNNIAI